MSALFTASAPHEINAISESQLGDGSSTDDDRSMVGIVSLLHFLLKDNVEQYGRDLTALTAPTDVYKKSTCCPLRSTALLVFP
ncbi:hypothetical protein DPMN_031806 [Dreissena polymorpha]|uniref:Uncharacterized protein n=1 Tax=Dreissena polymorpha TaxID=45954 RepID=A0A9D4M0P0_DREPO|nr:hypothetical protein DPMN_031806 [Dreissena polymorpha]